jgi:plasmid stability protein
LTGDTDCAIIAIATQEQTSMAQVIVRNLPDEVVARLKARAAGRKRSLEQELRDILSEAARPSREEILADIDRIRAMTPRKLQSDSTDLIREDRDRGWE